MDINLEPEIKKDVDCIVDLYQSNKSDQEIVNELGVPLSLVKVVISGLNRALSISPNARINFISGHGQKKNLGELAEGVRHYNE